MKKIDYNINLHNGEFAYGIYISLKKIIFEASKIENEIKQSHLLISQIFKTFFKRELNYNDITPELVQFVENVVKEVVFWQEQEKKYLDFQPTQEEISAGIKQLNEKVGIWGTLKTIGKDYHIDPEEVLQWNLNKVFHILRTDLEESKYQRRLKEVYKHKTKRK